MTQLCFPQLIYDLINNGIPVKIFKDKDNRVMFNLQTQTKSELFLHLDTNGTTFTGYGRYNAIHPHIETIDDVCCAVHDCMHGRDYISDPWKKVLLDRNYIQETVTRTLVV
jgi:hypothetical protein